MLTTGMPDKAYRRLRSLLLIFPTYYRFRHKISDASLEKDRASVAAALDRIEQQRQGHEYLVGHTFTIADLTAASLLAPVLQPPEFSIHCASNCRLTCNKYRATLLKHPAAQWAASIYRLHRGRSAETSVLAPAV
jgi:glutathione S-transferase